MPEVLATITGLAPTFVDRSGKPLRNIFIYAQHSKSPDKIWKYELNEHGKFKKPKRYILVREGGSTYYFFASAFELKTKSTDVAEVTEESLKKDGKEKNYSICTKKKLSTEAGQKIELSVCNCYKEQWTLIEGKKPWILEAKNLSNDEYLYILPNDVWIENDTTGYLLAHIKHDDEERHIHLFTFNPANPKELKHKPGSGKYGALLSPENNSEGKGEGGIYEASLNVVVNDEGKEIVYIHYVSWVGDNGTDGRTFRATCSLDDLKNNPKIKFEFNKNRKAVTGPGIKLNVKYDKYNEHDEHDEHDNRFYAINGNYNLEAKKLQLFSSGDGIDFKVEVDKLLDEESIKLIESIKSTKNMEYWFDNGAHIEFLGKNYIWFVYYVNKLKPPGIRSRVFKKENSKWIEHPDYKEKTLVNTNTQPNAGYKRVVDSPAIYKYKDKWYMFLAGSNTNPLTDPKKSPYADSRIFLFSCECKK